jgi:ferredoxin
MKACPLNSLQPVGLAIGITGLFTPKVVPRGGACEPLCNVCGHVCPTGAIRAISREDKIWAKIGTAQVLRQKCLAWEFGKRCLVCDETCPYDAVEFRQVPDIRVAVPFINENRCSGCGYCEFSCPVQGKAAIVVEPMEAIRIETGSYRKRAEAAGLSLRLQPKKPGLPDPPAGGEEDSGLPPGFTE